jgi:hypothetical protein
MSQIQDIFWLSRPQNPVVELGNSALNIWSVGERGANDDQRNKFDLNIKAITAGHLPPHSPITLKFRVIHGYWRRLSKA